MQSILTGMESWFSGAYVPVPPMYCRFYICGPDAFQKSVVDILERMGAPEEQIHLETFKPTDADVSADFAKAVVRFTTRQDAGEATQVSQSVWEPEDNLSLLETAERNGLTPAFGCRSGTCGLCSASLENGEVVYSRKPSVDVPDGKVLLCCTYPKGDVEIDF